MAQTANEWVRQQIAQARKPGAAEDRRNALAERLGLKPPEDSSGQTTEPPEGE